MNDYVALCKRCDAPCRDAEPFGPSEFIHPAGDCVNAKTPYMPKRVRRAKNRGAWMARRMRG